MSKQQQYLFRPLAEQDMAGIYDYTLRQFGENQADSYLRTLFDTFQRLLETPGIARKCDEVKQGLRSYSVKAHIVFFRECESGILIARVLHQSMDYQSQQY